MRTLMNYIELNNAIELIFNKLNFDQFNLFQFQNTIYYCVVSLMFRSRSVLYVLLLLVYRVIHLIRC